MSRANAYFSGLLNAAAAGMFWALLISPLSDTVAFGAYMTAAALAGLTTFIALERLTTAVLTRELPPTCDECGRPIGEEPRKEAHQLNMARAPWTDEQVENLRSRQAASWLHPYTLGQVELVPTREGWRLPDGKLVQDWAHRWDAEGDFPGEPNWGDKVLPGEGR